MELILLLGSFPPLYPDEVLYSGIARYHQRTAGRSFKDTMRDLYDGTLVCGTVDLPSHLRKLTNKFGGAMDTERLINFHTLLPYYRLFLTEKRYSRARYLMEVGSCWGEVHSVVGLLASGVKNPSCLRYCSICYRLDEQEYGTPYWHRVHQLPGVLVCPIHNIFLTHSAVRFNTNDHKHEFTILSSLPVIAPKSLLSERDGQQLLYIAQQSLTLLNSSSKPIDSDLIRQQYLDKLQSQGYITETGRFKMRNLIDNFKEVSSEILLEITGEGFNSKEKETWLHRLLRKPDEICHPLRHLSILCFLGERINLLMECGYEESFRRYKKKNREVKITSLQHTSEELTVRRCRMNQTISSYGENGRKEIRLQNQKDYTWLYRHDRAWLMEALPGSIKRRKKAHRINWKERDAELVLLVAGAVSNMLNADVPVRISSAAVGRQINRRNLIDKHLNKLPRTKDLLKSHIETTEQFQIRRLEWAFEKIMEEEDRVLGWRLLKRVGIPDQISEIVLTKLKDLLRGEDDLFILKLENRHSKEERELNVGFFSSAV